MNHFSEIRNDLNDIKSDFSVITNNLINIEDDLKLVNNHLLKMKELINKNTRIYKEMESNM